ncbi:uncharacterized protein T551_02777 [Pneumocystis jirovecii RU7]|uniref:Major surface glycoprotein 2 C-terminal domain-containing protein n=1 Tax=Pneumocystis jirovecii (strain RU7) TaxID=1408657 RepID=A0A0W4ZHF4_PNEJ7|nr:uncharacterized protein T551_02777 [Pneumocystis jirovecii RU7]KTW27810.1 hypothetical protein T551_02777 [Pneumocystis jirovecii RU7]
MASMCNKKSKTVDYQNILQKIPNDTQNLILKITRVKRQALITGKQENNFDEDHLLAFILRMDYKNESKCKENIRKYCKYLQDAYLNLNDLDSKLNEICRDTEGTKCKGLESKIKEKCQTLKLALKNLLNNSMPYDRCEMYQPQCLFLETVCSNEITIPCNTLRNKCYQNRRDDLAKEVLLRALKENLQNIDESRKMLMEYCPFLSKENDELMKLCLNQKETTEELRKAAENNCKTLESINGLVLKNIDSTTCYSLLEKCYFYQPNCNGQVKVKCNEITKKCRDQKVAYTPPDYPFDPVTQDITIQKKTGLKELYKRAKFYGVYITKPGKKDIVDFLLLLIQNSNISDIDENKCISELKTKCDFLKNLRNDLKSLCDNNGDRENVCKTLVISQEKCSNLKKELYKKGLSSNNNKSPSNLYTWRYLTVSLTEEDCAELLSKCFYLKLHCPRNLNVACRNLKAACYKKGLSAEASEILEKEMHNVFDGLKKDNNNLKKCQEILVKKCKALVDKTQELFILCIDPRNACIMLLNDIKLRHEYLFQVLNKIRDMPEEHECFKFQKLCEQHKNYSDLIHKPCTTLRRRCSYLSSVKQLKDYLLKKNESFFSNKSHCIEDLGNECRRLFKRRENPFNYSCVWQEETCDLIYLELISHCNTLVKNMKNLKVIQEVKDDVRKEEICTIWVPYCEQLSPLCNKLTEKTDWENGELCKKLIDECKIFLQKKNLEDEIAYELKGNLSTKEDCMLVLKKYCTHWENTNNLRFVNMCKSITNNDHEKVKEELCERLVSRIAKQCSKLLKEIIKVLPELQKKQEEYEAVKKEVNDEMKKLKVVLSEAETRINNLTEKDVSGVSNKMINIVSGFRLMKRENLKAEITEKELLVFEKASRVYGLYLVLKKKCHLLLKDCRFKKECNYEDECEKIEDICKKLEPFQVIPYLTKTMTEEVTTMETETIIEKTTTTKKIEETENREKTITEDEICTTINTIDIWVTHISTYISTSIKTSIHTTTKTSTITSTVTLMSTKKFKLTKSTAEKDDIRVVEPNKAAKITGLSFMKRSLIVIIISFVI